MYSEIRPLRKNQHLLHPTHSFRMMLLRFPQQPIALMREFSICCRHHKDVVSVERVKKVDTVRCPDLRNSFPGFDDLTTGFLPLDTQIRRSKVVLRTYREIRRTRFVKFHVYLAKQTSDRRKNVDFSSLVTNGTTGAISFFMLLVCICSLFWRSGIVIKSSVNQAAGQCGADIEACWQCCPFWSNGCGKLVGSSFIDLIC